MYVARDGRLASIIMRGPGLEVVLASGLMGYFSRVIGIQDIMYETSHANEDQTAITGRHRCMYVWI